jgi:superfamily II DNA/RNA helicase
MGIPFHLIVSMSAGSRVSPQTEGNISLSDVQTLVMDEADTLLDHSFYDQSSKLIKVLQYVCTSTRNLFSFP